MPLHKKVLKYRKASVENEVRSAYSSQEHRAIFESIEAKQPALAEKYTIEHIANAIPNTKDIDIYSAVYQFESLDPMLVKAHAFRRAGRKLKLDDNISIAQRKEQQLKQI